MHGHDTYKSHIALAATMRCNLLVCTGSVHQFASVRAYLQALAGPSFSSAPATLASRTGVNFGDMTPGSIGTLSDPGVFRPKHR